MSSQVAAAYQRHINMHDEKHATRSTKLLLEPTGMLVECDPLAKPLNHFAPGVESLCSRGSGQGKNRAVQSSVLTQKPRYMVYSGIVGTGTPAVGEQSEEELSKAQAEKKYTVFIPPRFDTKHPQTQLRTLAFLLTVVDCVLIFYGLGTSDGSALFVALLVSYVLATNILFIAVAGLDNTTLHTLCLVLILCNCFFMLVDQINTILLLRLVVCGFQALLLLRVRSKSMVVWFSP